MSGQRDLTEVSDLRFVVATNRPMIRSWFADWEAHGLDPLVVVCLPMDPRAVAGAGELVSAASVAVVDAVEPIEALDLCAELRACRPGLPIAALFCCPECATAPSVRGFVAAGVRSFLDLELAAEETVRRLRCIARGHDVIHMQLGGESSAALRGDGASDVSELGDVDRAIVSLVASGLTDQEIGREVYLSPHTVKHRIERLRRRVHARNRVQLAAWAGRLDAACTTGRDVGFASVEVTRATD
jgi:DNA-binding NarL/FixJ family response regulator